MTKIVFNAKIKSTNINKVIILRDIKHFNKKDFANIVSDEEFKSLKKLLSNETKESLKFKQYNFMDSVIAVAVVQDNPTELDFKHIGGHIAQKMKKIENIVCYIPNNVCDTFSSCVAAYNVAQGFELGGYTFDKYFTTKKAEDYSQIEQLSIVADGATDKGYHDFSILAEAVNYARDFGNEPANYLLPEVFASEIQKLEEYGLEIEILNPEELKEIGFNLLLAVAQGSDNPARVAVIKWHGNKKSEKYVAGFVGKGVTFDSGGLSLKPSSAMADMHRDMSGAAAVVATLKAVAMQKLKVNIVGVVGLVENMPSGHATRVNDIVYSLSGQTVEILNTDAEGRLVLADCLWYLADNFHPEYIVDIATLTGAVSYLFGCEFSGIMGNDKEMIQKLTCAGEQTGEKLWELPLTKAYNDMIKSNVADMKNVGGKIAGGMTAACFLQRFIQKGIKWAHIDMAGNDVQEKATPVYPQGSTGWGVMLLERFIKNNLITK